MSIPVMNQTRAKISVCSCLMGISASVEMVVHSKTTLAKTFQIGSRLLIVAQINFSVLKMPSALTKDIRKLLFSRVLLSLKDKSLQMRW